MTKLPKQWWDLVLDGSIYRIDVRDTPYVNVTSLRSVVYREAENRFTNVVTHKLGIGVLIIQAWGNGDNRPATAPSSLDVTAARAAPTISVDKTPPRTYECDCGQGPISHPLTCSIWTGGWPTPKTNSNKPPQVLQQVTQQQPVVAGGAGQDPANLNGVWDPSGLPAGQQQLCTCAAASEDDHLPWCTVVDPDGQVPGV